MVLQQNNELTFSTISPCSSPPLLLFQPALQDRRYLNPLIEELRTEEQERAAWDTVKVKKDKH